MVPPSLRYGLRVAVALSGVALSTGCLAHSGRQVIRPGSNVALPEQADWVRALLFPCEQPEVQNGVRASVECNRSTLTPTTEPARPASDPARKP